MKRIILKSLVMAIGMLLSLHTKAYDICVNGIYCNLNTTEKTAEAVQPITGHYSGDVEIPSSFDYGGATYQFTSIAASAFSHSQINSISIPSSITSIGAWAFWACEQLTSVTLPEGVISIGAGAFQGCTKLATVHIPSTVISVGEDAFLGTAWYNNQTDGMIYINSVAYRYKGTMPSNTALVINEGTTMISGNAFWCCSGLVSITIPSSVTSIGSNAFGYCSDLSTITIPASVTDIGYGAFEGTAWYNNKSDGLIYINNMVYTYKGAMPQNTNLTIISGTKKICEMAFANCSNLKSVSIPSSIISIGDQAFSECSNLTSVISKIESPFVLTPYPFQYISSSCTLTVPYGTTAAYIAKGWTTDVFGGGIVEAPAPSSNITFADAKVKALCVAKWDTNKDGELSEAEAAAVTSLGSVFKENTQITSFDELQYFTGLTSINQEAFYCCYSLTSVTIPSSVTSIEMFAFEFCRNLISVTIPSSVRSIGYSAFYGCSSLPSVTISNNVTSIGTSAFSGCSSVSSIKVESGNTIYDSRNKCNAIIETSSNTLIQGCKDTTIPTSVTSLGKEAFYGCTSLTSVNIPNSITSIGYSAFYNCSGLTAVNIPNGVTLIDRQTFYGCSNLTSVTIPSDVTYIGNSAFSGCAGLKSVISEIENPFAFELFAFSGIASTCTLTVPYGTKDVYIAKGWTTDVFKGGIVEAPAPVKNITFKDANVKAICVANWDTNNDGELSEAEAAAVTDLGEVFKNNIQITSFDELQFFTGLTSIGERAFSCSGLTSVTIPNSTTSIGKQAFYQCTGLTSFTIPNSVTSIGVNTFSGCSKLISVTIGNSVTEIGEGAFSSCRNMTSASIGNNVKIIGNKAFWDCASLVSTNIPNSVTTIGDAAFIGCGLTSVTIPSSVETIGSSAFCNCSDLIYVTISNGVKTIGNAAFQNCGFSSIIIPNSVTSIGDQAFSGCRNMNSVSIGNNVKSIGNSTFTACVGLTSVTIPNSVTCIGDQAFSNCVGLTSMVFPNSVTSIGSSAFHSCRELLSVTIPNSVTSIGEYAFYECKKLASVTSEIEEPFSFGYKAFDSFSSAVCTLTIPYGTKDAYIAKGWTTDVFKGGIVEAPDHRVPQSVTLASLPSMTYGDATYTLPRKTNEGLDLIWTSSVTSVATINGNILAAKGAGSATITATQAGNDDYKPFNKEFMLTVAKAPLTITAQSYTIKQGEAMPTFAAIYTGFKNNETPDALTIRPTMTCSTTSSSTPGTYDITPSGASSANYKITYVKGALTVLYDAAVDNTLAIENAEVSKGGKVVLPVNMNNTESITALQFEVALPTSNDKINVVYQSDFTEYGQDALPIGYSGVSDNSERQSTAAEPYSFAGAPRLMGSNDHVNHGIYWGARGGSNGLLQFGKHAAETANGKTLAAGVTAAEALYLETGSYILQFSNASWEDHSEPFAVRVCRPGVSNQPVAIFEKTGIIPDVQITHIGSTPSEDEIPMKEYEFTITDPGYYYIEFEGNAGWCCWLLTSLSVYPKNEVQNEEPVGITISKCQLTDRKGADHTASYKKLSNGNYQVTVLSISKAVFSGTEGAVVNLTLDVDKGATAGAYPISITNIELTTAATQAINPADVTAILTINNVKTGDTNGDGKVSITDAVAIVGYILGENLDGFIVAAADANGDGNVNIFDVTKVINIILGEDYAESKMRGMIAMNEIGTMQAVANDKGTSLMVDNAERYIAMQFDVVVAAGQSVEGVTLNSTADHLLFYQQTEENRYRVLACSMLNTSFEPTEDALVDLKQAKGAKIENAMFVTTDGRCVNMTVAEEATGIETADVEESSDAIYNLSGQYMGTDVNALPNGTYIRNQKKFVIK